MWKVTPANAVVVRVLSASAMSCAVGALTAHILTKKYMTAKYETLIEDEVHAARLYFSKLNKTGDYADPIKLSERLKANEGSKEYFKMAESYSKANVVPDRKPSEILKPEEDEDMESFEKRIIEKAKVEVEDVKERLGLFEEDEEADDTEEEVVTVSVFETQQNVAEQESDIYVISKDSFENDDSEYTQNTLTYFADDDVLADERDQPIHNKRPIVGEDNLRFGEESNDPNIVYIRNDILEVDFEVCLSEGSFAHEVLGVIEHSDKRKIRKFRETD